MGSIGSKGKEDSSKIEKEESSTDAIDLQRKAPRLQMLPLANANLTSSSPYQLTVLSYNILADCFQSTTYFPDCNPRSLEFTERAPKVVC